MIKQTLFISLLISLAVPTFAQGLHPVSDEAFQVIRQL